MKGGYISPRCSALADGNTPCNSEGGFGADFGSKRKFVGELDERETMI